MGRALAIVAAFAFVAVLGTEQVVASLLLRDRAESGSWVRLVSPLAVRAVDRIDLGLPLPQTLLLIVARHALEDGDLARASAVIARLRPSPDAFALRGGLDAARGDPSGALAAYLAAGDLADVEARIAELAAVPAGIPGAIALQRRLVARLSGDATERDLLAEAYYELGIFEENEAYRFWLPSKRRTLHERRSAAAYERAVALAPTRERFLIAYGNQLLNVERYDDAQAVFARARTVNVTDSTPLAGLGEAALLSGRRDEAIDDLARAERLNANDPAVERLSQQIGS